MEIQKKQSGYADNQIRILLSELNKIKSNHSVRLAAVNRFQDYISDYKPPVSPNYVDYLYTGILNERDVSGMGLLFWCGASSSKHDGQLKRIAAPIIDLLRHLITLDNGSEMNIYLERFLQLSIEDLMKIKFSKHILSFKEDTGNKFLNPMSNESRNGGNEDALEILAILSTEHRASEEKIPPIVHILTDGNKKCAEKLEEWKSKSHAEYVNRTLEQFRGVRMDAIVPETRPVIWEAVDFKPAPLQEGEQGEAEVTDVENKEGGVPDPLNLTSGDLKAIQALYLAGRFEKKRTVHRLHSFPSQQRRRPMVSDPTAAFVDRPDDTGAVTQVAQRTLVRFDEDEEEDSAAAATAFETRSHTASVIPSEKGFIAGLFLKIVHSATPFENLPEGLVHLQTELRRQSKERENLIRNHFDLFVHCSDDLEWLKAFRIGTHLELEQNRPRRTANVDLPVFSTLSAGEAGELQIHLADRSLHSAKTEAMSTLAPILNRMKVCRTTRNAEKVLRRIAAVLDHPHRMQKAMLSGDLEEVVVIYQKITQLLPSPELVLLKRVKENAEILAIELRRKCVSVLMTPEADHSILSRYGKVLYGLSGEESYRQQLKKCFDLQLHHFHSLVCHSVEEFKNQVESVYFGSYSSSLRVHHEDGMYSLADTTNTTATSISTSKFKPSRRVSEMTNVSDSALGGASRLRLHSTDRLLDSEVNIFSGTSLNGTLGQGRWDPAETKHGRHLNNAFKEFHDKDGTPHGGDSEWEALDELLFGGYEDTSHVEGPAGRFFAVRCAAAEALMDLVDVWTPCLHSLAADLVNPSPMPVAGVAATSQPTTYALNMFAMFPAKALCDQLAVCCACIKELIVGVPATGGAIAQIAVATGPDTTSWPSIISDPNAQLPQPLSEAHYATALQSVGDLYAYLTGILLDSDDEAMAESFPDKAAQRDRESYTEALAVLKNMAQANEIMVAERALDSLLGLCLEIWPTEMATGQRDGGTDVAKRNPDRCSHSLLDDSRGDIAAARRLSGGQGLGLGDPLIQAKNRQRNLFLASAIFSDFHPTSSWDPSVNRLECFLERFEWLMIQSLRRLAARSRRAAWVCTSVGAGTIKVLKAVVEELHWEKSVLQADRCPAAAASGKFDNNNVLAQLEDELLDEEFDSEKSFFDLLRTCIAMRSRVTKRVWAEYCEWFPPHSATVASSSAADSLRISTKTIGWLTMLFEAEDDHDHVAAAPSDERDEPVTRERRLTTAYATRLTDSVDTSLGHCKTVIEDLAAVEAAVVAFYIRNRLRDMRMAIFNSFAIIIKTELIARNNAVSVETSAPSLSSSGLSRHIVKAFLTLTEEKFLLDHMLGDIPISDEMFVYKNVYDEEYRSHEENSICYKDFISSEVCQGLLGVYADLIKKMKEKKFATAYLNQTALNLSSSDKAVYEVTSKGDVRKVTATRNNNETHLNYPQSYRLALEEFSYLQNVIREAVPKYLHMSVYLQAEDTEKSTEFTMFSDKNASILKYSLIS